MTPFEKRVLAAAEIWFKSLLRFDKLRAHERSLFAAVAEWMKDKKHPKNPWDVPPTLVRFSTDFEEEPPTLINDVPKESEKDPAERPTMRAPAATEDLRKRLKP